MLDTTIMVLIGVFSGYVVASIVASTGLLDEAWTGHGYTAFPVVMGLTGYALAIRAPR